MRLLAVLALGTALALAGCFGGDDDENSGDANPTPTTPVTTTPATGGNDTGTGGTDGNETGSGDETPPPAPAPTEVYAKTFDFSGNRPTPPATTAVATETFAVPEGYGTLTLNVTWTATGPVIAQSDASVAILGADGAAIATCDAPAAGPTPAEPPVCTQSAPIAAAGDYTVQYQGTGNLQAAVSVVAS